jgi:hypothetical protein
MSESEEMDSIPHMTYERGFDQLLRINREILKGKFRNRPRVEMDEYRQLNMNPERWHSSSLLALCNALHPAIARHSP